MHLPAPDERGFFQAVVGDGRPLLIFCALCLSLAGGFALFQSATGHFMPHDRAFLEMTEQDLCGINECRIVHFMIHDRVSFGGTLIAIGLIYFWMAEFPLRRGEAWSWWLFVLSGTVGFGSFLAYLGYGYLDVWHGVATLALLPAFVAGLVRTRSLVPRGSIATLLRPGMPINWRTRLELGRNILLMTAAGVAGAGATIMCIGMTTVFVPQDLEFIGLDREYLQSINPRLIPLIAHDRAGFGGGLFSGGLALFFCLWCGAPSRSLWQMLALAGSIGFGCAILVHPAIGYTDFFHLLPSYLGAAALAAGLALSYRGMVHGEDRSANRPRQSPTIHEYAPR